jgi:opacity protein-like surface antigen
MPRRPVPFQAGPPRRHALAGPALAALLAATATVAIAADPPIALSGFGTIGAVYDDRAGTTFRRDIAQASGDQGDQWSLSPDSMLGVQASDRLSDSLEADLQVLSRNDVGSRYAPRIAWAYLKYSPSENSALRAGRLGIEMYIQGDSVDIGYANLAVRPPIVFMPRMQDGVDAETTLQAGDGTLRAKVMAGLAHDRIEYGAYPYDFAGSRLLGALADYAIGGWTLRLAGGRVTLNENAGAASADALDAAVEAVPDGAQIEQAVSLQGRVVAYLSTAAAFDRGPLQAVASFARVTSQDWSPLHWLYATAGYRLADFTPYASAYDYWTDRATIPTGIPAEPFPAAAALNQGAALAQAQGIKTNQSGLAVGLRVEISESADLKLQIDRIRYRDPYNISDPSLDSQPYGSRGARSLDLFSVALDFVF